MSSQPRYFIVEHWGHIFSDGCERGVRFVLDTTKLEEDAEEFLVAMQFEVNGAWSNLNWIGRDDVLESLEHNQVFERLESALGIEESDFLDDDNYDEEESELGESTIAETVESEEYLPGDGRFSEVLPEWAASQ